MLTTFVAKLKAPRERKRLTTGKCEGRKSHAEINPEMVQIVKGLRRRAGPVLGAAGSWPSGFSGWYLGMDW